MFGPSIILPDLFSFTADLGSELGQLVSFSAALVLFNDSEHLAAMQLFDTATNGPGNADAGETRLVDFERPLRFYRGTNFAHLGRALEALPDLEAALSLAQDKPNDDDLYLSLLNNIGGVHDALGDKEQALEYYNQALPLSRAVGDRAGEATTLNNMAVIYFQDRDYERTAALFREVAGIFKAVGAVAEEAAVSMNLAYVLHYGLSETAEAVKLVEHAIELLNQHNLPFDAAGTSIEEYRTFLEELSE